MARVTVDVVDGVADVRLNRPERMNAIDAAMFDDLLAVGERLGADRGVRAVVLSGEGRAFSAGLDTAAFADPASFDLDNLLGSGGSGPNRVQRAAFLWSELAAPTIAAVHGVAYGGALQLALGCDFRVVAPDAKLGLLEINWGIVPDMGATQFLPPLVGLEAAKDLVLTGRTVLGEEAVRLGLASRSSATPLEEALALARHLAARNPQAVRAAKALLNGAAYRSAADGFRAEEAASRSLWATPNMLEAVRANQEQRPATFTD